MKRNEFPGKKKEGSGKNEPILAHGVEWGSQEMGEGGAGTRLESAAKSLAGVLFPIVNGGGRISALLIFLMGALTIIDILSRSLFNVSITATIEVESFMLSMVVFLGIAYAQKEKRHVSVDVISLHYPEKLSAVMSSIGFLLGMVFFAVVGWQLIMKALRTIASNEVSPVAHIPYFPFFFMIAFGSALMVLVLFTDFLGEMSRIMRTFRRPWLGMLMAVGFVALLLVSPVLLRAMELNISSFQVGVLFTGMLMLFIFAGFPLAFAFAVVGTLGSWYLVDVNASLQIFQMSIFSTVSDYFFTVIPFFVGMGFLFFASDLSKDLFNTAYKLLGRLPGGLAISTVMGSAGFAAICGDSLATAATMGSVALPEMRARKYHLGLATGALAAGGTLGILIPPSIGFIIYGIITEQSIAKLFMGGLIPGICLATLFSLFIYLRCKFDPQAGPPGEKSSIIDKIFSFKGSWPVAFLFLLVMGGIWLGWFSATEGGAVGLCSALVIGLLMRRLSWKKFVEASLDTVNISAMIFTILIGVNVLNYFMGLSEMAITMAKLVSSLEMSRYLILGIVLGIYVILGCLMNIIPMIMLTLPMVFPTILELGFDPIWFGVIMVIIMETGQITPPVGINVFVISGVAKDVSMARIFRGILPFVALEMIMVVILTIFPDIAMVLPDSMEVLAPLSE